jgi:hypothetical protein
MNVEIGNVYRMRNGKLVAITNRNASGHLFGFEQDGTDSFFYEEFNPHIFDAGFEHECDIVERVGQ